MKKPLKNEPDALRFVPDQYKAQWMCERAVENEPYNLKFVPDHLKTQKLCDDVVDDDMDDEQGPPLLGMKEKVQIFFDLQKESKNLTIEKKVKKAVFMAGPYKGYDLSYVALYDTKYVKRMLKMSGLE